MEIEDLITTLKENIFSDSPDLEKFLTQKEVIEEKLKLIK